MIAESFRKTAASPETSQEIFITGIDGKKRKSDEMVGRRGKSVQAGVEVSNPAGERLRTRVLHQSVIKAMSVLSSAKKVLFRFAAETSTAPRKSSLSEDEYAWKRNTQGREEI